VKKLKRGKYHPDKENQTKLFSGLKRLIVQPAGGLLEEDQLFLVKNF
jgi:hypothetical protein